MLIILMLFCLGINSFDQIRIEQSLLNREWGDYKQKHMLGFSEEEKSQREEIFLENYRFIVETNARNLNFTLEMNKFGHLTKRERERLFIPLDAIESYQDNKSRNVGNFIPGKFDWREKDVVSHVKNQHNCAAGYAFSAVGAIESAFAIKTGNIIELSEQEIVSCTKAYGNHGCCGGWPENAFAYCEHEGLSTSIDYPYTAKESPCSRNDQNHLYRLKGYKLISPGDEVNLIETLFNVGPISIVIDALHNEFLFYKSGILNIPSCSSTNLNHAALAVGYRAFGRPYLLVKNSFDPNWGEKGYFRIALLDENMCGIASRATYPIPLIRNAEIN